MAASLSSTAALRGGPGAFTAAAQRQQKPRGAGAARLRAVALAGRQEQFLRQLADGPGSGHRCVRGARPSGGHARHGPAEPSGAAQPPLCRQLRRSCERQRASDWQPCAWNSLETPRLGATKLLCNLCPTVWRRPPWGLTLPAAALARTGCWRIKAAQPPTCCVWLPLTLPQALPRGPAPAVRHAAAGAAQRGAGAPRHGEGAQLRHRQAWPFTPHAFLLLWWQFLMSAASARD